MHLYISDKKHVFLRTRSTINNQQGCYRSTGGHVTSYVISAARVTICYSNLIYLQKKRYFRRNSINQSVMGWRRKCFLESTIYQILFIKLIKINIWRNSLMKSCWDSTSGPWKSSRAMPRCSQNFFTSSEAVTFASGSHVASSSGNLNHCECALC